MPQAVNSSELLPDDKVELAATLAVMIVKSVPPVNSEKSYHRQEDPDTDTCGTPDLERIEIPYVRPAVTSFKENQSINRRLRLKHHRIAQLDSELVINISGIIVSGSVI